MQVEAKILEDSVSPHNKRLTTFEVTFPRVILAEVNTHRVLSRNSASSRAIPSKKLLRRVIESPYVPAWTKNQKGMQGEPLSGEAVHSANRIYMDACEAVVEATERLHAVGAHKQDANRLLEPFMWHTALITATEWDNFFHLRNNPDAHPAFEKLAAKMQKALNESAPVLLNFAQWHLPLVYKEDRQEFPEEELIKICVGRCARVSYLTHYGTRDPKEDIALHDKLLKAGHMSPFEHAAKPGYPSAAYGNFMGWIQYRKMIPGEHDILGATQ